VNRCPVKYTFIALSSIIGRWFIQIFSTPGCTARSLCHAAVVLQAMGRPQGRQAPFRQSESSSCRPWPAAPFAPCKEIVRASRWLRQKWSGRGGRFPVLFSRTFLRLSGFACPYLRDWWRRLFESYPNNTYCVLFHVGMSFTLSTFHFELLINY